MGAPAAGIKAQYHNLAAYSTEAGLAKESAGLLLSLSLHLP